MDASDIIGTDEASLERPVDLLERYSLNSVRHALPDEVINRMCVVVGLRFRRRLITPVTTVLHMIMAALWPEESFAAAWQLQWCWAASRGNLGKPPSPGSVAKARARLPLELWQGIFYWLCARGQQVSRGIECWRGHRLVIVDGTTLTLADRPQLCQAFVRPRGRHGQGRYPLARVVVTGLANTMTIMGCRIGSYLDGEWSLLRQMLSELGDGDLLIADRAYAGAHQYAFYMQAGLEFLTRLHQMVKVDNLEVLWRTPGGFVTRLKVNAAQRRRDGDLPAFVRVRLVAARLKVRGRWKQTWLVTSLLDAHEYPDEEIVQLYSRRWRVETLLREVKVGMGADVLRSTTPEGVSKEILARLCAATIVRTQMVEAAIAGGEDPLALSFSSAVRALLAYAPAFALLPVLMLPQTYRRMLLEMTLHKVAWRPGRQEPRALRLEKKHYPTLHGTRAQWRLECAA